MLTALILFVILPGLAPLVVIGMRAVLTRPQR